VEVYREGGEGRVKKLCIMGDSQSSFVQLWASFFKDAGWDVRIITRNLDPLLKIKQYKIPVNRPLYGYPVHIYYIKKYLKSFSPDLISIHSIPNYGIYSPFVNKPYSVVAYGFNHLINPHFLRKNLEKYCVHHADLITTTDDSLKRYLISNFNINEEKIITFVWGINLNIFHTNYKEEVLKLKKKLKIDTETVILSPRTMDPYYRIHDILFASKLVLKRYTNVKFIFIRGYGSVKYENKLINEVKKAKLENNIIFIQKHVTPKEMAIFQNLSDFCVSVVPTDQFASSVIEAMACKTVPIVSDIESNRKWIKEGVNGFLVPIKNPKKIAEAIVRCIEKKDMCERITSENLKLVKKHFDWNKNAKKMEELYENLIKKGDRK